MSRETPQPVGEEPRVEKKVAKEPIVMDVTDAQWAEFQDGGQLTLDAPEKIRRNDLIILRRPDGELVPVDIERLDPPPHRRPEGVVLRPK